MSHYEIYTGESGLNALGETDNHLSIIEIHKHPRNDTDVSLLKLNSSLNTAPGVRSICLPEPNITHKVPEYALNAGWGSVDYNKPLQMGHKLLVTDFNFSKKEDRKIIQMLQGWNSTNMIITRSIDNLTVNCRVGFRGAQALRL